MAARSKYRTRLEQSTTEVPITERADSRQGILERRRSRRAQRQQTRLVSPGGRRALARQLRSTAKQAVDQDPIRRHRDALLQYRAASVRTDLLEIAAMLERAPDPDPACIAALHTLLTSGCDSPLYNVGIDPSELRSTLDHVRAGL
jgi:hypothetical protein